MHVSLVLLAGSTALDILTDVSGKAGPPEVGCYKLASFEEAGVSGRLMIMTVGEDGATERVISKNVNTALVGQNAGFHLPVSEAGADRQWDVFVHRRSLAEADCMW